MSAKSASPVVVSSTPYQSAFDSVRAEIDAVAPSDLVPINVDIEASIDIALGCAEKVTAMRGQIVKELPLFDVRAVDMLPTYARGLAWVHSLFAKPPVEQAQIEALVTGLTATRETLMSDASALAKRALIPGGELAQLHTGSLSYRALAFDVLRLVRMLRENAAATAGKSAVQADELDVAEQTADRLLSAVALREHGAPGEGELSLLRQRAFTLFYRAYDQDRRAVSYLRWAEDDADAIIPSLYVGRGGHGKKGDAQPAPVATPSAATPVAPVAPTTTTPATPAPAPSALRGGDPFVR